MESSDKKTKVLLVEDHAMFRERLAHLISHDFDMSICGETDNIRDAMDLVRTAQPDLALVDITLKGSSGLEFLKDLKAQGLRVPVLILSMHEEMLYAERVLAAGAKGYITKHENSQTLLGAMQQVLAGKVYLSPQMTDSLLKKMSGQDVSVSAMKRLTDRELEVFQLIGAGKTTREIAEILNLGMTTVDTYRTRIKEKLGLRNGTQLQHYASNCAQQGLFTLEKPL
ncbi:two component transcriptional regulator, LuxR family [Chthoniobacter flavus Ellin428]|uniref:Two component transcriptional regulator, LuxR family n=1 Tax=Chthoniobacter flavus Ellin428 TaxID=497964 RepID=B4CY60_9BACT|nr:response regulator transcription factor [Chthoniobacter flavus]EDY21208.1 two component transcriptional regulator, LuxR family [Chthoniobacter flavus Ellin428]